MSLFDKVVAAVTPSESQKQRQEAHARAQATAVGNGWLSIILQQHEQLDAAFGAVKEASDSSRRIAAQKHLALLLTAHSNAEESVIYPALVHVGEKADATTSYNEQASAKVDMAELDYLPPMSQEYMDKFEHICAAVRHHMYEEENGRFINLMQKMPDAEQEKLTQRFKEEFERYTGSGMLAGGELRPLTGPDANSLAQPH